jgi:hypothetical protein
MALPLLNDNRKVEARPRPGQDRSVRPQNPDWIGGKNNEATNQETVNETFSKSAFDDKIFKPLGLGREAANDAKYQDPSRLQSANDEQYYEESEETEIPTRPQYIPRYPQREKKERLQLPKINLLGGDIKAKVVASRITISNASWIGYTWALVQLPLAILSIISFGIVAGLDSLLSTDKTSEYTGVLSLMAAKAASLVVTAIDSVAKFIGIDFAAIAFYIGAGFYLIILALGILSILTVYFQYIASGLRPTTGRGSGLKTGALLLAIIGYSTPMLNIFPFIFIWMAAVWYHPK